MPETKAKLVVITGATRGLGRAMTEGFARRGHTVVGCGRSVEEVERLRKELGPSHSFEALDVTGDDAVKGWAQAFLARFGPPDLLINNAATINKNAPLWEVSAAEFDRVVDVNLKGIANVIRHVVPSMIERGEGLIVNFSSYWGRSTAPEVAPYCASKWGVEGLTRALSQELPGGMAAVALNPGIIDTDMLRSTFGNKASGYIQPSDWADAAVPFLLQAGVKDNGKALTVPGQ